MRRSIRTAITSAIALAVVGGGAAVATAATAPIPANTIHGCVTGNNRVLEHVYSLPANGTTCPKGSFMVVFPNGARSDTVTAPSPHAVAQPATDLGGIASVATGGPFLTNSTEVGTVSLKAGTYLLNVNAKATPHASGDTALIFPQFFVYNQPRNAGFAGDLLNVGAGALSPDGTNHDSYYSGSSLITLATDTTLYVYAFGYDSDTGAGSYALDDLTVTAVQVPTS